MSQLVCDEELMRRLPLPLAQIYRRAHNAKSAQDRHYQAYYFWEAGLKLLAGVALVEYADLGRPAPELTESLRSLARPSIGHWWAFARQLVPLLADAGDAGFAAVRDALLGRSRDDLPRAAGLDRVLRETLDGSGTARSTLRLSELFERLVRYRNNEIGHGAVAARPTTHYDRMGRAMLVGVAEIFSRLDCLAGRNLLCVTDVRRQSSGAWLVERYALRGESAHLLPTLEVPSGDVAKLPQPSRVYLSLPAAPSPETARKGAPAEAASLRALHPLLLYDEEAGEPMFLNAARGCKQVEFLVYTSGRIVKRNDCSDDHRALLGRVLGEPVSPESADDWAEQLQSAEADAAHDGDGGAAEGASRSLGDFELISELGRGGMGIVYRAWQPSLGRQVAVKSLLRTGDAKADVRFTREIRALGKVEHANLIKIFTSGSDGDRWFYAMELVEGATLADVCQHLTDRGSSADHVDLNTWKATLSTVCEKNRKAEKPLSSEHAAQHETEVPPESAAGEHDEVVADATHPAIAAGGRSYVRHIAELIRQVAGAAHALHEASVLHRDIKPGNIMLSSAGSQAVLMDLGLAQLTDEVEGRLTRTRQFVGTLRYASPEQVLAVGSLDRRSDVYGLGATLWELLTLKPLYQASEDTPDVEVMRRIQLDEPERVRRYNPNVPRDLDAIVLKCLEKKPERRYASAAELADDLERFLNGEVVAARPVGEAERLWRMCRRNPLVSTLAAAVVLLLAFGLAGVTWKWREAAANAHNAEINYQQAEEARQAAVRQHELADQRSREVERLLEVARRGRYSSNLQRVGLVWQRQPDAALRILFDESQCPTELRDFTWGLYHRLCRRNYATFVGHSGDVTCVTFSPDGRMLASAGADRSIRLWDVASGQERATLGGHSASVTSVAFSPDGRVLVSGSEDRSVRLWDLASGTAVTTLGTHTGPVRSVAFSPDGKTVASGCGKPDDTAGEDDKVKLWDVAGGHERATLSGHASEVSSVAFSPDAATLASASADETVKLWNVASGELRATLTGHTQGVLTVEFSPNGGILASGSFDGTIKLWDIAGDREPVTLDAQSIAVNDVTFSPDGNTLAAESGSSVILWEVATRQQLARLGGFSGRSVAFSPDGQTLAWGGGDRLIRLWEVGRSRERATLLGHVARLRQIVFSPDSKTLASSSDDGSIKLWDVASGRERSKLTGHASELSDLKFSPDGQTLASAGKGTSFIKLWDASDGRERATLAGHSANLGRIAFSPDGKTLASGDQEGLIITWDVASGRERGTLAGHSAAVNDVVFSPDGRLLASGSQDGSIMLWDVASGQPTATLRSGSGAVADIEFSADGMTLVSGASWNESIKLWDVASRRLRATLTKSFTLPGTPTLSPDGKTLASARGDSSVTLWEVASGRERTTLPGHSYRLIPFSLAEVCVAFSPDGRTLASERADSSIKLWDVAGGQELATLEGHTDHVKTMAFSPDGRVLATGSWDQTIKLWDAVGGQERATLAGHSDRLYVVAYSPDGKSLASGGEDGSIKLWDAAQRRERATLVGHSAQLNRLAFSPDGRTLASGADDGMVKLWEVGSGKLRATLVGRLAKVRALAFSPDGGTLASAHWAGPRQPSEQPPAPTATAAAAQAGSVIKLWEAATGQERGTLVSQLDEFSRLAFSADGRTLACGDTAGRIELWDIEAGREIGTLAGSAREVLDLTFLPDGRTLAVGNSNAIELWDVESRKRRVSLPCDLGGWNAAFSPDGKLLASAESDSVKLWDAASGRELARLQGHSDWVSSTAFSPDGSTLASASWDNTVRLWDVRSAIDFDRQQREARLVFHGASVPVAERAGDWFAAAFHLHHLIAAYPDDASLREQRGNCYAQVRWWQDAQCDYAAAASQEPDKLAHRRPLGWLRLAQDDQAGYRQLRGELIAQFGEVDAPDAANAVASCGTLLPADDDAQAKVLLALARRAVVADKESWSYLETLGAAQYRNRQFAEASKTLARSAELQGEVPAIWTRGFRALTLAADGRPDEARAMAGELLRDAADETDWQQRVVFTSLRRELEQALPGLEPAPGEPYRPSPERSIPLVPEAPMPPAPEAAPMPPAPSEPVPTAAVKESSRGAPPSQSGNN